jgi:hypothetical protein
MPTQVVDREHVRRQISVEVNRSPGLFLAFKRRNEKRARAYSPTGMTAQDIKDIIELLEGELEYIRKNHRTREQYKAIGPQWEKYRGQQKEQQAEQV